jgi:acetyltransferase-like isoleucine patch superfamily enzyme
MYFEVMKIFERLHSGETIPFDDPDYGQIFDGVKRTMTLLAGFNSSVDFDKMREIMSEITGRVIHEKTTVFSPFHTNYGAFIEIGKNVFINSGCTFLALGRIVIEDDVLIGPKVSLITEGHPLNPADRKSLFTKQVTIKQNAWIGAGATILPGVTVGENSVVAACSLVSRDVPPNTVVAGTPAKVIKTL